VAFLASDDRGYRDRHHVGRSGAQPQRISTFAIEHAIQGYA
jgi:hypothetical protein